MTKMTEMTEMTKMTKGTVKIVPCLDVKGGRVVKGIKFVNIKDAGDPVEFAQRYQDEGADALAFLDITASIEGRSTMLEWVKSVADVVKIPFTVGGGISDVDTARKLKAMGASCVSINSAAIVRPGLIAECSYALGKESVVLAVDVARASRPDSRLKWEVLMGGGSRHTGIDAVEWVEKGISLGCGAILPTVLDKDGTQDGFDLDLIRELRSRTDLPIFASGGAGKLEHFSQAAEAGADMLLAASVFHFGTIRIDDLKNHLLENGFGTEDE